MYMKPTLFHWAIVGLFVLGLTYHIFLGLQGIDTVDVGFCNTFYDNIFSLPDTNIFNFIYYLTGIIGGSWQMIFNKVGLLGFRVLEAFTLSTAIGLLMFIFRQTNHRWLLVAISVSFLFPMHNITFHYDTLTYLLLSLSAFFFSSYSRKGFFMSGVMIGLSFFARIVNISFLALLLIPTMTKIKDTSKNTLLMLFGVMVSISCMFVIMLAFGHTGYWFSAIEEGLSTLSLADATHSKMSMLSVYFHSILNIVGQGMALLILFFFVKMLSTKFSHKQQNSAVTVIYTIGFIITCIFAYASLPYLTLLAGCLLIIIINLTEHKEEKKTPIILFLLVTALLFPLGSDIGIQGIFHWSAGLLVFPCIWFAQYKTRATKIVLFLFFMAISTATLLRVAISSPYGASKPRSQCTSLIKGVAGERLNVMTDSTHASRITDAANAIMLYKEKDNNLLLLANQESELYYATSSAPFLGHTQTVIYLGDRLRKRLDERLRYFRRYPLVVFLNWAPTKYEDANKSIINLWLREHHYKQIYCNNGITIYKH